MKRGTTFILSDENVNSLGYRVLTAGIDIEAFKKNPVMLWMHIRSTQFADNKMLPIGIWDNIRKEGNVLLADPMFDEADDFAMQIYSKYEQGIIKSCSIGAIPVACSEDTAVMLSGQTLPTVTQCVLQEVSLTDIPGNSNALRLSQNGQEVTDLKSFLQPTNDTQKMEKTLISLAALMAVPATEEDVLKGFNAMKQENVRLAAKILELETKVQEEAKISLAASATSLVELAESKGKITPGEKPHLIALASTEDGFKTVKAMLDAKPEHISMASQLSAVQRGAGGDDDQFKGWDFFRFQRENPVKLAWIMDNDPEWAKRLNATLPKVKK